MQRFSLLIFIFCIASVAQTPQIRNGSALYIEPMDGYETYLAAALQKKHVPVTLVEDVNRADFVMRGNIRHSQPASPTIVVKNSNVSNGSDSSFDRGWAQGQEIAAQKAAAKNAMGVSSLSISVVDPHSSQIIFSYSTAKMGSKQLQDAAEDCAKHLGQFVQKPTR